MFRYATFEDFKAKHQNDQLIMQSLNELNENPLFATFHIKANNLEDYPAVAEKMQSEKVWQLRGQG